MSTWTEELKTEAIEKYLAEEPTPETSIEIIKQIAEDMDQSPNGVRMVLVQANVYIKKDATAATTGKTGTTKGKTDGDATKRVSKESQVAALKAAIEAKGGDIDDDILSKLTGKAAAYFTTILKK